MTLGHQVQQILIQKFNAARARIFKNRLKLISFFNLILFASFLFAIFFYQWMFIQIHVKIKLGHNNNISKGDNDNYNIYYLWINQLYLKQSNVDYYQTFSQAQSQICLENDIACNAMFLELRFTGFLCFFVFTLALALQIYDLLRILYYVSQNMRIAQIKDNFRHILTISAYFIGLTLSTFSLWVIEPIHVYYGISFWICIGTLMLFIAMIIIQKIQVRNMQKRKLIQDLINQEKKIRAHNYNLQRPLSEEISSEFQI